MRREPTCAGRQDFEAVLGAHTRRDLVNKHIEQGQDCNSGSPNTTAGVISLQPKYACLPINKNAKRPPDHTIKQPFFGRGDMI